MMDIQTEEDSHKGALFPRVHVSETRVPGPRAPPRNKMALFEQFTIPPHRFVPPLVQEVSHQVNSQNGGHDINSGFVKPNQVKLGQLSSNESNVSCGKAKCETLRCSVAELCFYSETSKRLAMCDSGDKDCSSLPARHANELPPNSHMQNRSTAESDIVYYAKQGHSSTDIRTQHDRRISLSIERMTRQACGCTGIEADKLHALVGAIAENHSNNTGDVSHGNENANTESLVGSAASSGRSAGILLANKAHIAKAFLHVNKGADECIRECNGANDKSSLVQQMVCSDRISEVAGDIGQQKRLKSLRKCDVDRLNSDFLPSIIPKHVIGVIGQREFWEARKTMLQQQKALSMQVFELHRLIEVQRLIAAMPGLLLEGKGKCFVVKGSTQPEIAKVSNKLVTKESLNKEAKYCAKQKQAVVKRPKKLIKSSCDVGNTTVIQNPSLQVLPLKPVHVSLDHSRVSTWGFIPTPFVQSQWLKPGSHNYGLCRGPMDYEPPTSGHWYNGQQVLQNGSYVFTNWMRPCNFLSRDIPNPPLASQKLVNDHLIHQLDCAPGAPTNENLPTPNKATSVLRKPSNFALKQHNKPINSQQEACTTERQRSSDCNKLVSQSIKFTGDRYMPDKAKSVSLAGSHEFWSERSGLGFQTFHKMVSIGDNESDSIAQPAKVKDMISVTESSIAHKNDTLFSVPLQQIVSSVQKGEKNGFATSKVIRAVPHPASEAVQAAAKILKFIQQSESSQGMVH